MLRTTAALLLLTAAVFAHAAAPEIWMPRQHAPDFAEPGKTFVAELRAASNLSTTGWSATVKNELRAWNCTVTAAAVGRIHHSSEDGWRLTILIPADAPPELLDLTVSHAAAGTGTSIRALKVVPNFEENFYIIQVSDQHLVDERATQANGKGQSAGSAEAMGWTADAVNILNPRFFGTTGDNITIFWEGSRGPGLDRARQQLGLYMDALERFKVPTIIELGNHDIGWLGGQGGTFMDTAAWRLEYQQRVGQRCSAFRMGSFYVMSNEWTFNGPMEWLNWAKSEYLAAYADTSIKFRLLLQHSYDRNYNKVAIPCPDDKPFSLGLGGHTHGTGRINGEPYPFLLTGTNQEYQKAGFFNFQKTSTGWTCPQVATHIEGNNVFTLVGAFGAPKVSLNYGGANDGTRTSNTAAVLNGLPQDFYDGRVKFLMAKGAYNVTGGTVLATYDDSTGTKTAVVVKVNLIKNSTTNVSITAISQPQKPATPSNLTTAATSTSQINLNWTDTASNETGFKIERKTGSAGAWTQIATTGANVTSYSNTGLSASTQYYFRVRANNAVGDSAYSNEANTTTHTPQPPVGSGTGLRGEYFDNADFTAFKLSRVDGTVNFDWVNGAPDASIGIDTFSVRWSGQVQAQYSQTYTFYMTSDDGVRVWVNGQKLIDNWTDHAPTENSGTIALTVNQKVNIVVEFYENTGGAVAQLSWSSPSTPKAVVPKTQLYPAAANSAPTLISTLTATPNPATTDNTVAFAASAGDANNDVLAYTWNFGDGTSATGANATRKFSAPGTYTASVSVTDGRGGIVTGIVVVIVTSPAVPPVSIKVNFQPAGATTPAGYLADTGAAFGNRGNGYSYGWNKDNSPHARDRNAANSPDQRYDTLIHLQKPENPNAVWEIAIPNGTYTVRIVNGDPSYFNGAYRTAVEGVLVVNATPTATARWFEGTKTISVNDGRLTITSGAGADTNKICFVEINNGVTARELAADAPETQPLTVTKLQLAMNFAKPGRDSYRVSGTLPLGAEFTPKGVDASIDVGAAIADFTMDSKGRGKNKTGLFALKFSPKSGWSFQASLKKGVFSDEWLDGGLENQTVAGQSAEIPVTLTFGVQTFGGSKALTYKAKVQKSGAAK